MTLLKNDELESRAYQEVIAASASNRNTLVVLPTGLGKTIIAVMVASMKLQDSKILMLAPTKPLVSQHMKTFQDLLELDDDEMQIMTGDTRPNKRYEYWDEKKAFFATPQVVENDLVSDEVPVEEFGLTIFDEAHRATGEYSYVFINEKMRTQNLALTASPGGSKEKVMEVAENLQVENFEVRTEDDPDVEPYIEEKEVTWMNVELDDRFREAKSKLESGKRKQLKKLKSMGQMDSISNVTKGDLLKLRGNISSKLSGSDDPELYSAISRVATALKISQAVELLETQGVSQAYSYLKGLENDDSKAASRALSNDDVQKALQIVKYLKKEDEEHPKLEKLREILGDLGEEEKALVFTEYRDTVDLIAEKLEEDGIPSAEFIGQSGDEGMSQTEQIETVEEFSRGEYRALVSTSIGEEGLDIPAVDYVIFYEPVASSVRDVQRRGRTGREESGEVYVLIAEDTRDEGNYWAAHHRKKKMNKLLNELKNDERVQEDAQSSLKGYASESSDDGGKNVEEQEPGIKVYADDRESAVAKELSRMEITVKTQRLDVADFLVSEEAAVERKEAADFVDSILDSRLFDQVNELQQFGNPVIIIEGKDLYSHRDVHPNAIQGALSSLALDYGIPVLWSDDHEGTAQLLSSLAKREQEEKDREVSVRGESTPSRDEELKKFVVAGLPGVNTKIADRMMESFQTVEDVFTAEREDLKEIEGVGEKKADTIRKLLTE